MTRQRVLALISGFIECGTIVAALMHFPEWVAGVVLVGTVYQVGCFLHRFDGTKFKHPAILVIAAGFCLTGYTVIGFYLLNLGQAWALQEARATAAVATSGKITTFEKRAYRIAGFLLSAVFAALPWIATLLVFATIYAGIMLITLPRSTQSTAGTALRTAGEHRWFFAMVAHQMQYFVYAYAVWFPLKTAFGGNVGLLPVLFALGWLTYIFSEKLFGRYDNRRVLLFSHLILAAILLTMWVSPAGLGMTLLWIATGFFGGSVYCFARLNRNGTDFAFAEDLGHVFGALVSLGLVLGFSDWRPTFLCAAAFACSVAVLVSLGRSASAPIPQNHGYGS
jgi:hypothetical protein